MVEACLELVAYVSFVGILKQASITSTRHHFVIAAFVKILIHIHTCIVQYLLSILNSHPLEGFLFGTKL